MNTDFIIEKKIRDNQNLRQSFNQLAMQTWGFDFEDWYQNGYWGESYIPYVLVHKGRVAANVSVNLMTFAGPDGLHRYIQLGTVMTAPEYRRQGLCRRLMEEVHRDFEGKTEGFYLFANDSVLDFYPRFGYRAVKETGYSRTLPAAAETAPPQAQTPFPAGRPAPQQSCAYRVSMKTPQERAALEQAIARSAVCGSFDMRDNAGLILFYVTKFMQENVYLIPSLNAYVIAETEGDALRLHAIFAPASVDPLQAALALTGSAPAKTQADPALTNPALKDLIWKDPDFGGQIRRLELGFTPADPTGYERGTVQEEDTTLFIRGAGLEGFEKEAKRFPTLSHA